MKYYVHHVPGRLRIKIPALRRHPEIVREIEEVLDVCSVRRADVNPVTGSVVVHYDPELARGEDLLVLLEANGLYDGRRAFGADELVEKAASRAACRVRKVVVGWAMGKALEANGLSLLAALI